MTQLCIKDLYRVISTEHVQTHIYSKCELYDSVRLLQDAYQGHTTLWGGIVSLKTDSAKLTDFNLTTGQARKLLHHIAYIYLLPSVLKDIGTDMCIETQYIISGLLYNDYAPNALTHTKTTSTLGYIYLVEHEFIDCIKLYTVCVATSLKSETIVYRHQDYMVHNNSHVLSMFKCPLPNLKHRMDAIISYFNNHFQQHGIGGHYFSGDVSEMITHIWQQLSTPTQPAPVSIQPSHQTVVKNRLVFDKEWVTTRLEESERRIQAELHKQQNQLCEVTRAVASLTDIIHEIHIRDGN
jgi:hypothetical protein